MPSSIERFALAVPLSSHRHRQRCSKLIASVGVGGMFFWFLLSFCFVSSLTFTGFFFVCWLLSIPLRFTPRWTFFMRCRRWWLIFFLPLHVEAPTWCDGGGGCLHYHSIATVASLSPLFAIVFWCRKAREYDKFMVSIYRDTFWGFWCFPMLCSSSSETPSPRNWWCNWEENGGGHRLRRALLWCGELDVCLFVHFSGCLLPLPCRDVGKFCLFLYSLLRSKQPALLLLPLSRAACGALDVCRRKFLRLRIDAPPKKCACCTRYDVLSAKKTHIFF